MTPLASSLTRFALRRALRVSVVCAACLLVACTGSRKTTDSGAPKYASVPRGPWDGSDAETVADSMIGNMLESKGLRRWTKKHERPPTMGVFIQNETMSHIDTDTHYHVTHKLKKADTVQVVPEFRRKVYSALRNRPMCSQKSELQVAYETAQEAKVDLMVFGTIRSTVKEELKKRDQTLMKALMLYTVNLHVVNVETDASVWHDEQEIWHGEQELKKIVKGSKVTL